jgi:hypothetical protein
LDGVPVSSGTTTKLLNLTAGFVRSNIGNPLVGSVPTTLPVACRARNVDCSDEKSLSARQDGLDPLSVVAEASLGCVWPRTASGQPPPAARPARFL